MTWTNRLTLSYVFFTVTVPKYGQTMIGHDLKLPILGNAPSGFRSDSVEMNVGGGKLH